MPLESPTNCWTINEAWFATALANSAAFQAMTSSADASAAAAWIFGEQIGAPVNGDHYTEEELTVNYRHYAQVYSGEEEPYGKRVNEPRRAYTPFGATIVYLHRQVTESAVENADIPLELEREWKNKVGDIIDQILSYADDNGGPYMTSIAVIDGPGYNARERWAKEGVWQGAGLQIEWTFPPVGS